MIMFKKNKIFLFIFLTVFFSFLVFITKNYFFWWFNNYEIEYIEQNYIDPTIINDLNNEKIIDASFVDLDKKIEEKILSNLNSASKIDYSFIPQSFLDEEKAFHHYENYDLFLNLDNFYSSIKNLDVIFYKNKWVVRWNMKNKTIRLYWLNELSYWEVLSVWIHEFSHYLDLYILDNSKWTDISNDFYNISWESTKVLKAWLSQVDFVSWYSMTNKYEDFAESFTYYVLHNDDFYTKAKKSDFLMDKYNFFKNNIFKNWEFITNDFKKTSKIEDYYRDVTKIDFYLENFLQYLKKWI